MNNDENIKDNLQQWLRYYSYLIDTPEGLDVFEKIWAQSSNNLHIINNVKQRLGASAIILDVPFDSSQVGRIKSFAIVVKNYYGGIRKWLIKQLGHLYLIHLIRRTEIFGPIRSVLGV